MSARAVVADVSLLAGAVLQVVAVLGVTVMRDAYDRMHYVSLAGYGGLLIGAAVLVREGFSLIGDKALAVGVILILTGPVLAHATVRSLRIRELGDWRAGIEEAREDDPS